MTKVCTKCHVEKDVSEFYKGRGKGGKYPWCKSCCKIINRKNSVAYYHRNKEQRQKESRNYTMLRKFGIGVKEYNQMFARQQGCCAICGQHQEELSMRLAIDHNHETGDVRSLLCGECNLGLGKFKDKPELLRQAAQYLESWGKP